MEMIYIHLKILNQIGQAGNFRLCRINLEDSSFHCAQASHGIESRLLLEGDSCDILCLILIFYSFQW